MIAYHAPNRINALDSSFLKNIKTSCIVLSNNFENEKNMIKNIISPESLRIFEVEELKIDNSHEIIKEAYISSSDTKYIAIFAYSYNVFAQNSLLKILEEPPRHILFIIYSPTRNRLLPTIFSRLIVFDKREKVLTKEFPLDISRLNIPMVYEYIRGLESQNITQEECRSLLGSLLNSVAKNNIYLKQKDLERFDLALKSLHHKQSPHLIFLPILLSLIKGKI